MHTLTGDLSDTQIKSLVQVAKNNVVTIDTTNGFDNAQVCAGGISTEEITPDTMESRYVRHLPGNCWMWTASAEGTICNGPGRPVILPELLLQTIYHQIDDKL